MSLFYQTKEELCDFMEKNFRISSVIKQKIISELIDGEVLFEFTDEDYKIFELKIFPLNSLKFFINEEKNNKKETKKEEIVKKLKSFGINKPDDYLLKDLEKLNLKIGQKKLLKKYINIINSIPININSSSKEILIYFKVFQKSFTIIK